MITFGCVLQSLTFCDNFHSHSIHLIFNETVGPTDITNFFENENSELLDKQKTEITCFLKRISDFGKLL